MKIADIHPFEGHPFYVKDDKDMDDLVDSVKKFGVLEPAVVIPRKAGGFEMISGHRRRRACELAGIATMPVIVRQLDRDEATISMVDANLKRENISPMEKARAYKMKLEAMKHKAGRRTKEEKAALEASGKKPMRADEELAQQTGESRANIQKIVRLNELSPELQQMVEEKKLPGPLPACCPAPADKYAGYVTQDIGGMTMSTQNTQRNPHYKLLSRDTIQAATQGEPDAVATVLRHYEGYIAKLSTRCLFDEYGNTYLCVDEALRRRLEIKLITGVLAFRAA